MNVLLIFLGLFSLVVAVFYGVRSVYGGIRGFRTTFQGILVFLLFALSGSIAWWALTNGLSVS